MTNKDILIRAFRQKNKKAAAWIRKAGGIDAVTEGMAERIVKLCKLKGGNHERT